jgi:hypothetical protein
MILPESLTNLQWLTIDECKKILTLPESLTSLHYLTIKECPKLEQWCEENFIRWNQCEDYWAPPNLQENDEESYGGLELVRTLSAPQLLPGSDSLPDWTTCSSVMIERTTSW